MKPHTILLCIAVALVANGAFSDQASRKSPESEFMHAQTCGADHGGHVRCRHHRQRSSAACRRLRATGWRTMADTACRSDKKTADNVVRGNTIIGNKQGGVYSPQETEPMAGHRITFEKNTVRDNRGIGFFMTRDGWDGDSPQHERRHGQGSADEFLQLLDVLLLDSSFS